MNSVSDVLTHWYVADSGVNVLCCAAGAQVARLKRNWMIVHGNSFAFGLAFTISYPSLHQFITTPTDIVATNSVSGTVHTKK